MNETAYTRRAGRRRLAPQIAAGLIVAGLIAAVALTGCTALDAQPAIGTVSDSATPSAVASPSAGAADPNCDTVSTPEKVRALVGGTGSPQRMDALEIGLPAARSVWAIANARGSVCGWGGWGPLAQQAEPDAASWVTIRILPNAEAAWTAIDKSPGGEPGAAYDGGVSRGGYCRPTDGIGECSTNVLVDGSWLNVKARQQPVTTLDQASFHAFVQAMIPAVASRPAVPLSSPGPRPSTCYNDTDLASFRQAYGFPDGTWGESEEVFRIEAAALGWTNLNYCAFSSGVAGSTQQGSVSIIADGADGLRLYSAAVGKEASPVTVKTQTGDFVGISHVSRDPHLPPMIFVDVLVHGCWLQVGMQGQTTPDASLVFAGALASRL